MTENTQTITPEHAVAETEELHAYRLKARAWLAENMPLLDPNRTGALDEDEEAEWLKHRRLQGILHAGGYAGIAFPKEYGGQGLTPAHQRVFTEESLPYQMPLLLNVPTLSIGAPVIMEFGTEEQKQEHIPKILRGEEIVVQFLSEPGGGSDLGGVTTRAERTEDGWLISGAKTWSTCAYAADIALCLARTDWDVPKHDGLTMFLVPTKAPGLTMNRIRMVNDTHEFCEEFLDQVAVPDTAVVGEVGQGWAVAMRQLYYERTSVGGGSPHVSGAGRNRITRSKTDIVALAQAVGRTQDPTVRELVGLWHAEEIVQRQLISRVTTAIKNRSVPAQAASLMMLYHSHIDAFTEDIGQAVAAGMGAFGTGDEPGATGRASNHYLMRQASSLAGGSAEMARNVISERVLGMPREHAPDRGVPFREVRRTG